MIADILTVAWKELREMLMFGDSRGRSKLSLLVILVVFGVVIPLQSGRDWVTSPVSAMVWAWMPYMWVYSVVADSFAGERERHTLEALLDHGQPEAGTIEHDLSEACRALDELDRLEIDVQQAPEDLQTAGVRAFADSFNSLIETIRNS